MKYSEEKIIKLLGEDFSGESKIRQSLKLRLPGKNEKGDRKKLFLKISFSAAAVLLMFALFALKKNSAREQYVYGHYPVSPLNFYSNNYGKAGPRGLPYKMY
jgi:hypothetical protein